MNIFPRTWSEELIAEWLELKGYFVETGAVVSTSSVGDRTEVDIIGAKISNGVLAIRIICAKMGKKDLPAAPAEIAEDQLYEFPQSD